MTHVELELDDGRRVTAPFGFAARGRDGDTVATEMATFMLADSDIAAERTHLTVRYRFLGIPRSMAIDFSASDERQRAARAILEGMPNAWIGVTSSAPHRIYFTNLLSYKCALREIRWGTGDGPMDRRAHFTPSESLREGVDTKHDDLYANLPTDVDRVRIELVYKDGTTSGPRTIRLSDAAR